MKNHYPVIFTGLVLMGLLLIVISVTLSIGMTLQTDRHRKLIGQSVTINGTVYTIIGAGYSEFTILSPHGVSSTVHYTIITSQFQEKP